VARFTFRVILGLVIGIIEVLLMLPLAFRTTERHSSVPSRQGLHWVSSLR
jgi:hypothetical protein